MTDFCPKCGKKADENEKICSICGEKITSLSSDKKNEKRNNIKNKISFINKIVTSVVVISLLYVGGNIVSRYFNAGKNIESNKNNQKSELKILKNSGVKENKEEIHINEKVKKANNKEKEELEKEENSISPIEKEENTPVLDKKEEYMEIIRTLDNEVEKAANIELDGGEEKLLDYTSKIYKRYDVLLNMIYQDISSNLNNKELEALKEDEILWINKKDEIASSAVGSENTTESDENWVYFDSLATSTKERCYYLINKYMY